MYHTVKAILTKPTISEIYTTHNKVMTIAKFVDIFCMTELSLLSHKFKYIYVIKDDKI